MKRYILKLIAISIMLCVFIPNVIYADDDENEEIEFNQIWEEITQTNATTTNEPSINSRCAVVFDRTSKTIIYEKNSNKKYAMASTTKIMTAIITLESKKDLKEITEVSAKAAGVGGSRLGLKKGDKISLNDLLYGLMLCSRK